MKILLFIRLMRKGYPAYFLRLCKKPLYKNREVYLFRTKTKLYNRREESMKYCDFYKIPWKKQDSNIIYFVKTFENAYDDDNNLKIILNKIWKYLPWKLRRMEVKLSNRVQLKLINRIKPIRL